MEKGTWVVCIDDSNWSPNAYIKMSDLPVKNELYQVRELLLGIPGTSGRGIKLEGIYGEEVYFTSKNGKKYSRECHFRGDRFQVVDDLWIFLTEGCDVEEKTIVVHKSPREVMSTLVNNIAEVLTDEVRQHCKNVN